MKQQYYILAGHEAVPCDVEPWARWFGSADRRVAETKIGTVRVSTVFLGLDHNWGGGPPHIFETMIFGGKHDGWQDRYSTWEEAEAGHAEAVKLARHLQAI